MLPCSTCGEWYYEDEFYLTSSRGRKYIRRRCMNCTVAYNHASYEKRKNDPRYKEQTRRAKARHYQNKKRLKFEELLKG